MHLKLKIFFIGFLVNLIYLIFYRVLNVKFPLNIIGVFLSTFPILGLSLGSFLKISKKEEDSLLNEIIFAIFLSIWIFCLIFNKGVPFHFFIGNFYYQYPFPQLFWLRLLFLFLFLFLSLVPFIYLGMKFTKYFTKSANLGRAYSLYLLGFMLAFLLAYFTILKMGAYLALVVSSGLLLLFLKNKKVQIITGLLFVLMFVLGVKEKDLFFLWSVKKYKYLTGFWSPYYKLDFVSFNKDKCLGGVYNNLMTWYTCNDVKLLPREAVIVAGNAAIKKAKVLVVGRTDGVYPQIVREKDLDLKKLTALEFDLFTPKLMKTKFAKYNNYIFKDKNKDVGFVNLNYFLKEPKEKFDLFFFDGIGIRLFLLPKTMIFMEDFLLSKEVLDLIFHKLLTKKGVFILDWGSSSKKEALIYPRSIPADVHLKVFWATMSNYPFFGLPIFLIIGSKDLNELNRIAQSLQYNENLKMVPLKRKDLLSPYSIDKPFVQNSLAILLLFLSSVIFLPIFVIAKWIFKTPYNAIISDKALFRYFLNLGVLFSLTEIFLISRNSIFFNWGIPLNYAILSVMFFSAYFLGLNFFSRITPSKLFYVGVTIGLFFIFYASTLFKENLIFSSVIISGFLISAFFNYPLKFTEKEKAGTIYCGFTLGIPLGIYFFQFIIFLLGFKLTFVLLSMLYLFFSLFSVRKLKKNS